VKTVESEIIKSADSKPEVLAAFLFGSVARGKERPESDIDVAVLLTREILPESYLDWRLSLMDEVSRRTGREADVTVLNEAGPVLCHQVFRDGRLLFERDHKAVTTFKAKAMLEYVDWLPYKERLDRAVIEHFRKRPHG
jgi:uncharacterized protein